MDLKQYRTRLGALKDCQPEFKCLSDSTRQQILMSLINAGPQNVSQITERTRLSQPAISHHLKELRLANLVQMNSVGNENYYEVTIGLFLEKLRRISEEFSQI